MNLVSMIPQSCESPPRHSQDTEVLPLVSDPAKIWTFGGEIVNIDHEAEWRDYLAHDNFKAKGDPCDCGISAS